MIPAMGISMKMHKEITRASKELARKRNVCGLMNIQFAAVSYTHLEVYKRQP